MNVNLPSSSLQVKIASALDTFRRLYLQKALAEAIQKLEMKNLNAELDEFAPPSDLKSLAGRGIRGEFLFPVPCILEANPYLLGYYRLLLGFSQKEFYNKGKLTRFSVMEEKGILNVRAKADLPGLCRAFAKEASYLLENLGVERFSMEFLDDLTLLTLGPQLRGGINTMIGKLANQIVFDIIRDLIAHSVTSRTGVRMEVLNASQRQVSIAFSADPDISITERLSAQSIRNIVAIEIKGGTDQSNIWNRLGEAEKSHQSARQRGFPECWTICNVPALDLRKAKEKSPTTNHFYFLQALADPLSAERAAFRARLISMIGIKAE